MSLSVLAATVLRRLSDGEADFDLQALVRGEPDAIWLERRGPRLVLRVIRPGGGEEPWAESAFSAVEPEQAFETLADRIDLVALYTGGPLPEGLAAVFVPDESGPATRYRAEWGSWAEFKAWLV